MICMRTYPPQSKLRFCALIALILCLLLAFARAEQADRAELLDRLKQLGFLPADADYDDGQLIFRAIYNFQKANGIPAGGTLDPATAESLMSGNAAGFYDYARAYRQPGQARAAMRLNDSGKDVKQLQQRLKELGYYEGEISGEYDMATACALALFEAVNGFEPDGIADEGVQGRLMSASAAALSGFEDRQLIAFGDRGAQVKYLQRLLGEMGYFTGECTGEFGEKTQKAVIDFEQRNSLSVTGSWSVSYSVLAANGLALTKDGARAKESRVELAPGDSGYLVRELKLRLGELGYYTGAPDENYCERTRYAVMAFQEANSLPITGCADGATRDRLFSDGCADMDSFSLYCETNPLNYGQKSYGVCLMTRRLQALGYPVEVSWEYNDAVSRAVNVFQYAQSLNASDGIDAAGRELMNSDAALDYAHALPFAQEGRSKAAEKTRFNEFLSTARALEGASYEAGKPGPESFGTGGFTYYCYQQLGIDMPATVSAQLDFAAAGDRLNMDESLRTEGAQLFFRADEQLYTGIYLGGGKLVYASPSAGRVVIKDVDQLLANCQFAGWAVYQNES